MLIKICGITTPEAAVECFNAGADMIGLVYYPASPRHIDELSIGSILDAVQTYRTAGRKTVLVIADALPAVIDSRIDYVQCYGKRLPDIPHQIIPAVRDKETFERMMNSIAAAEQPLYCLEMTHGNLPRGSLPHGSLPGGNGSVWDWSVARPFCKRFPTLLAGGITPENVAAAIQQAEPYGVDVSSGVETQRGVKDFEKIERLIKNVRRI
ncbi:MAG: phosphoribosylanthranilate isomerase [Planctomycetaceae bacterium]|nr:phosphoribosylanthranilate isomerase [Planctomycetaceae bacterium]